MERLIANARDTVRDRDRSQAFATVERRVADVSDAVRDRNRGQVGASVERLVGNDLGVRMNAGGCGSFNQCHIRIFVVPQIFSTIVDLVLEFVATVERRGADVSDAVRDRDRGQAGAIAERILADARHAVRDRNRSQAGATVERRVGNDLGFRMNTGSGSSFHQYHIRIFIVPQIFSTIVDLVLEFVATVERIGADVSDAVRDGDRGQAFATVERRGADVSDTIGNGDRGQAFATGERIVADVSDTIGNGDRGQVGVGGDGKRTVTDARCLGDDDLFYRMANRVTID